MTQLDFVPTEVGLVVARQLFWWFVTPGVLAKHARTLGMNIILDFKYEDCICDNNNDKIHVERWCTAVQTQLLMVRYVLILRWHIHANIKYCSVMVGILLNDGWYWWILVNDGQNSRVAGAKQSIVDQATAGSLELLQLRKPLELLCVLKNWSDDAFRLSMFRIIANQE